jgi:hypothetical protein
MGGVKGLSRSRVCVVEREVVIPRKVELAIAGCHSGTGAPRKSDEENRYGGDSPTRVVISAAEAMIGALQLYLLVLSLVREFVRTQPKRGGGSTISASGGTVPVKYATWARETRFIGPRSKEWVAVMADAQETAAHTPV